MAEHIKRLATALSFGAPADVTNELVLEGDAMSFGFDGRSTGYNQ
jgi:hypothetical protein